MESDLREMSVRELCNRIYGATTRSVMGCDKDADDRIERYTVELEQRDELSRRTGEASAERERMLNVIHSLGVHDSNPHIHRAIARIKERFLSEEEMTDIVPPTEVIAAAERVIRNHNRLGSPVATIGDVLVIAEHILAARGEKVTSSVVPSPTSPAVTS